MRFLPRVLRDVTDVSLSTRLLGEPSAVPWGVAPTTLQRAVHPDGELAMARGCAAAGSVLVVSSNAGTPFSEIGATACGGGCRPTCPPTAPWPSRCSRARSRPEPRRSCSRWTPRWSATKYAAGDQVVWDVIDPALLRVNFDPGYDDQPGAEKATDLGPHDLGWLAGVSGLPVVVKGVLRADDARRCVQAGARAVWVSNHGGRQLDRAATTASALAAVVATVADEAEVYVDGGVRSGLDVLAALALGADAVFLGRLPVWALLGGEAGVARLHAGAP